MKIIIMYSKYFIYMYFKMIPSSYYLHEYDGCQEQGISWITFADIHIFLLHKIKKIHKMR